MIRIRRGAVAVSLLATAALAVSSCSSGDDPPKPASTGAPITQAPAGQDSTASASTAPGKPLSAKDQAKADALKVYAEFRKVNDAALQNPTSKSVKEWKKALSPTVAEPLLKLDGLEIDNEQRAKFHYDSTPPSSPKVTSVKSLPGKHPHTVIIKDCMDLTNVKMISDAAKDKGKTIPYRSDQPMRSVFEARLAWYPRQSPPKWMVYKTITHTGGRAGLETC